MERAVSGMKRKETRWREHSGKRHEGQCCTQRSQNFGIAARATAFQGGDQNRIQWEENTCTKGKLSLKRAQSPPRFGPVADTYLIALLQLVESRAQG